MKELQTLARHSDPRLTLGVYSHVGADALGASVARLPLPGGDQSPLAGMSRQQLKQTVFGLLLAVGAILGPNLIRGYTPGYTRFGDNRVSAGTCGNGVDGQARGLGQ